MCTPLQMDWGCPFLLVFCCYMKTADVNMLPGHPVRRHRGSCFIDALMFGLSPRTEWIAHGRGQQALGLGHTAVPGHLAEVPSRGCAAGSLSRRVPLGIRTWS